MSQAECARNMLNCHAVSTAGRPSPPPQSLCRVDLVPLLAYSALYLEMQLAICEGGMVHIRVNACTRVVALLYALCGNVQSAAYPL